MGKRHAKLEGDVIVASVPSLGRKGATRLEKYDQRYFKCIIIDEAHHAAAESYRRIINHFGAADPDSHIFVWGCSATVRRHDGLRLSGVFDYVAYYQDFMPMIEQGWLCKMKVTTIETKIDISDVKLNQFLDFKEADLSRRINTTERNDIVVRSHLKFAEGRCSTLVFAVDITHTMELCNTFRRYGVNARFITSETHQVERQETLQMFRDRAYPVLVNCGILTEGTDIPNIDCVLLARPTKSTTLFQQMLGRGMRLHPGKDNCLMLDFVDNFKRAGEQGLMSIPTLLGLDPKDLMEDADVLEANKKAEQRKSVLKVNEDEELDEEPDTTRKIARLTVTEYDNPYDIIDDCSGSPQLMKISQLSWLSVGGGVYVLQLKDGTVRVEQEEDGIYRAKHRKTSKFQDTSDSADKRTKPAFRKIQHPPVYLHLSGDDLPSAIRAVDTWVKTTYSHTGIQHLSRYAKFRKEPATEPQIRLLKKHLIGDTFDPSRLTKGQAMNILGRLFEGAGKKWRVEEEKKKKEEKRWSQERKWKEQMKEIMVGPIRKMEDV
ncbi:putative DEAD/DEAH box helicase [Jimgerdemannia flammicorona]|uniref:Putative DEAD/DEAH box helicase n=1 Tax=Jimgerdemannia flammicorona TaxID=994334 RepID=A0A433D8W8_9FUNG|nr:putative DEAD/DEAH box helicase [Jimgerdemannia flammicorona]